MSSLCSGNKQFHSLYSDWLREVRGQHLGFTGIRAVISDKVSVGCTSQVRKLICVEPKNIEMTTFRCILAGASPIARFIYLCLLLIHSGNLIVSVNILPS